MIEAGVSFAAIPGRVNTTSASAPGTAASPE